MDYFKVNVDTAFFSDLSSCCFGVIIVNDRGPVIATGSFLQRISLTVLEAEALALREGIMFASDLGFTNIVMKSDCAEITKLVLEESCFWENVSFIVLNVVRVLLCCFFSCY